jgi:hypothetical protein
MHLVLSTLAPLHGVAALCLLALIYAIAAVFSGLSGFGFSAIGCLSLAIVPPQLGIAMLMGLSLVTQLLSLRSLWGELRRHVGPWRRPDGPLPYLGGGTLGMPLGLAVLASLPSTRLTTGLGMLLIAYAAWSLCMPARPAGSVAPNRLRSFAIGALGGLVGGFSAFPGSALVVWAGLAGLGKEHSRALTQPFILWMQVLGLVLLLVTKPALFDRGFWIVFLLVLPAALVGNRLGIAIYRRTGDLGYRRITYAALGIAGLGLIVRVALR